MAQTTPTTTCTAGSSVLQPLKVVSRNLLPQRGAVSKKHAMDMYKFRNAFNNQVTINSSDEFTQESEEVAEFQSELMSHKTKLLKEMSPILVNRMISHARDTLQWKSPFSDLGPRSVKDLKDCIADKVEWETEERKKSVYSLLFGIFQKPNDQWLKDRITQWMLNNGLEYENNTPDNADGTPGAVGRKSEGCYYSVIKAARHDSINQTLVDAMRTAHGCEMCISDKRSPKRKRGEWYDYESLPGGKGYLKTKTRKTTATENTDTNTSGVNGVNGVKTEEEGKKIVSRLVKQFGKDTVMYWTYKVTATEDKDSKSTSSGKDNADQAEI